MEVDLAADVPVYERNGRPWRPLPGCTSTFEEFLHAREHIVEIWNETDWNPWRKDELAAQLARAEEVDDEWECADPDWKPLTKRQMGARMAAITRKVKAESKAREARWECDKARYDQERERARYALLEREAGQGFRSAELAELRSGARFPGMAPDKRASEVAELEAGLARNAEEIARLATIVGDREDVVDEHGQLPQDRRTWNFIDYRFWRIQQVEGLQTSIAEQKAKISETKDRGEKSTLRNHLSCDERRLQRLLAVPRRQAEQMCADCITPQFRHTTRGDISESRPCPRWPMHAARMEQVWQILRSASERNRPAEPEPPKPQPLATLPGNLAIGEVIERLKALQEQHPDAVVKRGGANRWELWPGEA